MSELPLRTPNPRGAPNPPAATDPPTFGTVRKEHNRLLLRQRVERTVSEFHDEVEQFVDLACSAGAYMQLDEYRDATQALVDGGSANETVAVLWRTGGAGKAYAIAQILPEVESNGAVPGIGTLDGTEDTVPVGQSLRAVGRASGQLRGKVVAVESDGTIVTDLPALPGDVGAPVVNPSRELIGLIWSTNDGRTAVRPIDPILRAFNVRLSR